MELQFIDNLLHDSKIDKAIIAHALQKAFIYLFSKEYQILDKYLFYCFVYLRYNTVCETIYLRY